MDTTDIESSISSLIEGRLASDWRHAPNSYVPPPAFERLAAAGDGAVAAIVGALTGAVAQVAQGGEDRLPTMFAIRDLMKVLARIDTPRSRSTLVAFLNRAYPDDQQKPWPGETPSPYWQSIRSYAIGALEQCGECADPEAVEGLRAAAIGPAVTQRRENLPLIYLLARKFGGRIPLSAEQAVAFAADLPWTEEAIKAAEEFADVLPAWPSGQRSAFYWFVGIRVEQVSGKPASQPYFAASVLANPARETAAWSKFPGVVPSPKKAAELVRAYPLAGSAPRAAADEPRRWWHRRSA